MARSLYVAGAGPESGKSAVALGVLDSMTRRVGKVGLFLPVVHAGRTDALLNLVRDRYPQVLPDDDAIERSQGVTYDTVHADQDAAVSTIVERFARIARHHDAVLVVGTDFTDVGAHSELDLNSRIAVNLGAPVLLVVSGCERTPQDVVAATDMATSAMSSRACEVLGVVANRVARRDVNAVRTALAGRPGAEVLPELPLLSAPLVSQVFDACQATPMYGGPRRMETEVLSFVVAAMTLPRVLQHLRAGALAILPGDRADMLVGIMMAHRSQTFPRLAGIMLTGGIQPEPIVRRLIDGLSTGLPVGATPLNTFEAATVAAQTHGWLTDASPQKVEAALDLFARHVDRARLLDRLDLARSEAVTPIMFEHELVERARNRRQRIVLPEGTEPRVLRAADQAIKRNIADIVLLGAPDEVKRAAACEGMDVSSCQILDPCDEQLRQRLAEEYARLRAHKGVAMDAALDIVTDVSYAGTLMVALGMADGMVSGAVHTTAQTIRPAFQVIRTVPGVSVISSVFFMCLADRVLVYADCAVNPDPTAEQLADIAISSAATAAAFGVEPRIAMLSYSTGESGRGADVEKVREATRLVRERAPHLQIEGPIQYDAAIDAGVASTKLPESSVAGRATVFVFPDLNTGNNTYKAVQRSAGAVAVGPVLQGLRAPVNDLSRGATVRDIVTTIAITAVQAQFHVGAGDGPPPVQPPPAVSTVPQTTPAGPVPPGTPRTIGVPVAGGGA